jgi:iron(III) transport system ATP-binding protein
MIPVLETRDLGLNLGRRTILAGVSLQVAPGETLAILGPSGSGKSSLIRLILGFLTPTSGEILIDGRHVSAPGRMFVPPEERGLSVVFQDLALWPHLTVLEHLKFVLRARRIRRHDWPRRADEILARTGLSGREKSRPGVLSGGERQRLAIARALVVLPRAVLLDEPLASADVVQRRDLLQFLGGLLRSAETPSIYVTHDPREAAALGARVLVLAEGRIIQEGPIDDLRRRPASAFVKAMLEELPPS